MIPSKSVAPRGMRARRSPTTQCQPIPDETRKASTPSASGINKKTKSGSDMARALDEASRVRSLIAFVEAFQTHELCHALLAVLVGPGRSRYPSNVMCLDTFLLRDHLD